ncbi:hypothetical protein Ngar_c07860 [Candidatus Nitrososphaera gargensis Ga9.2]|uniref:Uncharacterized protein n=1 Tax=Nitrososphaera gargensis (strain Ga9.2) TaxID=1237085 RepID=K0IFZ6_NITGG|nr:hypothetical protein [Candidatus Nitrososphaera gargensis]AFU57728.1 hypothetical protein Ngar_c07860 [Candidatus Nitrososphaera gargensis Ga9.2]
MEPIESAMWVALGFFPTLAALVAISKARIFRIRKYGRIAKIEVRRPRLREIS